MIAGVFLNHDWKRKDETQRTRLMLWHTFHRPDIITLKFASWLTLFSLFLPLLSKDRARKTTLLQEKKKRITKQTTTHTYKNKQATKTTPNLHVLFFSDFTVDAYKWNQQCVLFPAPDKILWRSRDVAITMSREYACNVEFALRVINYKATFSHTPLYLPSSPLSPLPEWMKKGNK